MASEKGAPDLEAAVSAEALCVGVPPRGLRAGGSPNRQSPPHSPALERRNNRSVDGQVDGFGEEGVMECGPHPPL